jgi:uncharacterized protein YecE (DUF72 family)
MPLNNNVMEALDHFLFRHLHPHIFIGTASDRYAGWFGQIYSRERYGSRIIQRPKILGRKTFKEEVLPLDSLEEYFEHFPILEIDYTFYGPLLDSQGKPTQQFSLLKKSRDYLKNKDFLFLKVPQIITARKIRKGPACAGNPAYLNSRLFIEQFYQPAVDLLGSRIKGFIFEQEYHRQSDRIPVPELAASLHEFFTALPRDKRYHLELRTESYLQKPLFNVLEKFGVGQVLSHWTWLPTLEKQFKRAGSRFLNGGGEAVIRLMTPRSLRYEEAYEKAFPFDKLIDGMLQPDMIRDTVGLMQAALARGTRLNIIVNNRSGGNAPLVARQIAGEFSKSVLKPV